MNKPIVYAPVEIDVNTPNLGFESVPATYSRPSTYLYNNLEYSTAMGHGGWMYMQLPDSLVVRIDLGPVIRQTLRAAGFYAEEPKESPHA